MKKIEILAFATIGLLTLGVQLFAGSTASVMRRSLGVSSGGGGGGGSGPVYESSTTGTTATAVTSSTDSVVITANTKAVVHIIAYRRNNGQNTISTKLNGVQMNLSTVSIAAQFDLEIYYATGTMIPGAGTYNIVDIITPNSPGLFAKTLTFKGTVHNVSNPSRNTTSSVTTSSVTSSGNTANDMLVGSCIVQDATLTQPVLNTPGIVAVSSAAAGGATGDGGYFFVTYGTFTATSFQENISWDGGARNHAHLVTAVNQ